MIIYYRDGFDQNIKNALTLMPYYIKTPEILPQNIILKNDLKYALIFSENKNEFPSAYYNIYGLKNNRTPHYDINCNIFNIADDRNATITKLYDNDKNYSYEYNTESMRFK